MKANLKFKNSVFSYLFSNPDILRERKALVEKKR